MEHASTEAQLAHLQARIEAQEGQAHVLRALVAALIAAHPSRATLDPLIAIILADLRTKVSHHPFPGDTARTKANQAEGMVRTWESVKTILDDWLPPDPA